MIAQKCPCVNNAPQNAGFCALSPSFPHFRAPPRIRRPHLPFRHRAPFASFALLIAPSALRRTLFRLATHSAPTRFVPRYAALSRAAAPMSGRIRRLPCRYVPARFAPALHISSKEQNPCARGAGVSSHCHVMFRVELTLEESKQAHRRRASWLQARSQPSTHPW